MNAHQFLIKDLEKLTKSAMSNKIIFKDAPVAQRIERWTSNPQVGGSNPSGRVYFTI